MILRTATFQDAARKNSSRTAETTFPPVGQPKTPLRTRTEARWGFSNKRRGVAVVVVVAVAVAVVVTNLSIDVGSVAVE